MDARLPHPVDDPRAVRRLEHVEHAEVAQRDAALHAARERLLGDVIRGQQRGIVGGVGVEVERHPERLRRLEEPVDVRALIVVHVGTAAQRLEPRLERLDQQTLRHRVVEDALLREGDEAEIERPRDVGLQTP